MDKNSHNSYGISQCSKVRVHSYTSNEYNRFDIYYTHVSFASSRRPFVEGSGRAMTLVDHIIVWSNIRLGLPLQTLPRARS